MILTTKCRPFCSASLCHENSRRLSLPSCTQWCLQMIGSLIAGFMGPHVGPMNIALCDISLSPLCCVVWKHWPHEMPVSYILSSVFLRWSLFPPLSCMQYMGCVLLTTSRRNAGDKVRHIVFQTLFYSNNSASPQLANRWRWRLSFLRAWQLTSIICNSYPAYIIHQSICHFTGM